MTSSEEREEQRKQIEIQKALDDASATVGDLFPGLWRRIYENSLVAGFNEIEAFDLVKIYILSQCPHGVHVHKT